MSAAEIHFGDVGTIFEVTLQDGTTAVDISAATTKQIIFEKPGGEQLTKAGVFVTDGTDGKLKYTTVADDLDQTGRWQIQVYVVLAAGSWKSDIGAFTVHANL